MKKLFQLTYFLLSSIILAVSFSLMIITILSTSSRRTFLSEIEEIYQKIDLQEISESKELLIKSAKKSGKSIDRWLLVLSASKKFSDAFGSQDLSIAFSQVAIAMLPKYDILRAFLIKAYIKSMEYKRAYEIAQGIRSNRRLYEKLKLEAYIKNNVKIEPQDFKNISDILDYKSIKNNDELREDYVDSGDQQKLENLLVLMLMDQQKEEVYKILVQNKSRLYLFNPLKLSYIYYLLGMYTESYNSFMQLSPREMQNAKNVYFFADLKFKMGQVQDALLLYYQIVANPSTEFAQYHLNVYKNIIWIYKNLYKPENDEKMLSILNEAIAEFPSDNELVVMKVLYYMNSDRTQEIKPFTEKALTNVSKEESELKNILKKIQFLKATLSFGDALKTRPQSILNKDEKYSFMQDIWKLDNIYELDDYVSKKLKEIRSVESQITLLNLILEKDLKKDQDRFLQKMWRLVDGDKLYKESSYILAFYLYKNYSINELRDFISRIYKLYGTYSDWSNIYESSLYILSSDYENAQRVLEKEVAKNKNESYESYFNLGTILIMNGDFLRAKKMLSRSKEILEIEGGSFVNVKGNMYSINMSKILYREAQIAYLENKVEIASRILNESFQLNPRGLEIGSLKAKLDKTLEDN